MELVATTLKGMESPNPAIKELATANLMARNWIENLIQESEPNTCQYRDLNRLLKAIDEVLSSPQ